MAGFFPTPAAEPVAVPARRDGFTIEAAPWLDMTAEIAAWDALAQCAAEPNPFFENWFLLPALMAFDPLGKVCLLRFEAGGELAGLLPVMHQPRYYRWPIPNRTSPIRPRFWRFCDFSPP
jgi:hypothetical protein